MIQDSGVSSEPGLGAPPGRCDTCALMHRMADRMTRPADSADCEVVDEDVVVLTSPGLVGLVVIPRHHVRGLEELPLRERAVVLATLRRVSVSIGEKYEGSAPKVVVTTDPPASRGHVGFQIVPGSSGD